MSFRVRILAVVAAAFSLIFVNACAPSHTEGLNLTSLSACYPTLTSGVDPVYKILNGQIPVTTMPSPRYLSCKTCHYSGSASAPASYYFADNNFNLAVTGFANIIAADPNKIYTKAYDNQHFGGSDPSNSATLEPLKAAYLQAAAAYKTCLTQQNVGPGPGPDPSPTGYDPKKITMTKTIPANQTTAMNLTWDLGTEMQTANSAITNGVFRITLQAVTSATGVKSYRLTAPSALGSSTSAIQIRNIRVFLNGSLVPLDTGGSTWISLNNLAPANNATTGRTTPHPLPQGSGAMNLAADTALDTNTIAIGFGEIAESTQYRDFNPSTYARLTATANNNNATPPLTQAERVFANRCQSCHSGTAPSGDVNLSSGGNNLQMLKLYVRVVPYVPEASIIHSVITTNDPQVLMPPTGALPAAEIRWIRDWILDGAN